MTADQGPEPPREETLEGVGEPAEERTMVEPPPPVDPDLVERMHRLRGEIAGDERAVDERPEP